MLCAVMRAPRTFTREDVVEITCHGGFFDEAGARYGAGGGSAAGVAGEFTQRAFLNGRLDLARRRRWRT